MKKNVKQNTYIGTVKLDYTHYTGHDSYTDGNIEMTLLKMAMTNPPDSYPPDNHTLRIEEAADWTHLYHLSMLRHNIIEWLPIKKTDKVLEIGSGCGAITGLLAEKAGQVVCVESSDIRSQINAYRHRDYFNITIHVGEFAAIEADLANDFDFIVFIGAFEYTGMFAGQAEIAGQAVSAEPLPLGFAASNTCVYTDMLRTVKRHLATDGSLVIAIENRFGLKYWAGYAEDHLGTYFSGLEDYPDGGHARTFTRGKWEEMLKESGFGDYRFFYPYPDYKFMTTLFSDERLPQKGELYSNDRNCDRHRLSLFNEKKVFDSIIEEGLFPLYSNSYLIYTGADTDIAYLRYANERASRYAIRTQITMNDKAAAAMGEDTDGQDSKQGGGNNKQYLVSKLPFTPSAKPHINHIIEAYQLLFNKYEHSSLAVNACLPDESGNGVLFEYINGKSLSWHLDECLASGEIGRFDELIDEFVALLTLTTKSEQEAKDDGTSDSQVYNHDLIFSNIILDEDNDGKWTLIDYEWMLYGETTVKQQAFRAMYCYLLEDESRNVIKPERFYQKWGMSEDDIAASVKFERIFHNVVSGRQMSYAEIKAMCRMFAVDPIPMIKPYVRRAVYRRVQIFFDRGKGYSEGDSLHLPDAYRSETEIEFEIVIPADVRRVRIDPADKACMVALHTIKWNGELLTDYKKYFRSNGKRMSSKSFFFKTRDPNIYMATSLLTKKFGDNSRCLSVSMEIALLPS
ncbi:MAG: hypothetical protein LBC96_03350 [Lachnospiraceae bacterium]|jgi:SAM-dependent methyltransferase|nr:hypothetical protein [Lachnospiraceae bacterium]